MSFSKVTKCGIHTPFEKTCQTLENSGTLSTSQNNSQTQNLYLGALRTENKVFLFSMDVDMSGFSNVFLCDNLELTT